MAHGLRRDLIRGGRSDVLAGTRFVIAPAAAVEVLRASSVVFKPGEDALRAARLSALFRSSLLLAHFSLDLLRSTPGWDGAFARSISDLEGAGLRPEDIEATGTSAQLRDVAVIWRALDESARHSWTIQRVYLEAAVVLERRPETWPFHGPVLASVAGDLTAAEARFLRAIPEATIALLGARPARKLYLDRMEALLGAEAGAALRSSRAPRAAANERDLLASYLFELPAVLADPVRPRSQGPDGTVDLEEHAGVESELEATGDWVSRQVTESTPLEGIAILVPELDPLAGFVAGRLRRLPWHEGTFPVYVAGGLPLAGFAAGARALSVVRALRAHLDAATLAGVLPALRLADGAKGHLSRSAAVNLLWRLGTVGGNPARPRGALEWTERAAEREGKLEERLAEDLRRIRPALDALAGVARGVVESTILRALWPMLRAFFVDWLLQPGEDARVEDALDEPLGDIAADATCGLLAGDDALRVVEDAILGARVPAGRFGEPAVYVGALREAVGLRFSAVRVLGLAEGHLPSASREDPVIPDASREALGRFVPTAADRALATLHAFDSVVRNAGSRIALSAPRLDIERSQREPSSVILEAAAALARPNRATGEPGTVIPDRVALERDAFAPARAGAAQFRRERPLGESSWHDGVAHGAFGLPAKWRGAGAVDLNRISWLLAGDADNPMDGLLGAVISDLEVPGLSADRPISPSAIETLLRCPHEFLLGRLLGLEEPAAQPKQREIGQPDYGELFHAVAADFYANNGASFCAREGRLPGWLAVVDPIIDRAFNEFAQGYPLAGDAVRRQQRERLRRDVHGLLEYDWNTAGPILFVATEKTFGEPDPIQLPAGETSLYIRGRIDRIDVCGETSLVRDLKTGRAHPRIGKEANPQPLLDLQIAVYGFVAKMLAGEWGIPNRIAAAYAYVGRGNASERPFRKDFEDALEPFARRWLEIAAGLLTERLFPRTPNAADCGYCAFRPVCGIAVYERAAALLAESGGVLAGFAALKAGEPEEED